MRLDVVAQAGPLDATPTARPEHVTAGGAARGSTRIETGARAAPVRRPSHDARRGQSVSASRSSHSLRARAQGVVHSGYARNRHDGVRALALPFRRPRLRSPSRSPPPRPSAMCSIRRDRASAHLRAADFRSPFPAPPAGSISARWRRCWRETADARARAKRGGGARRSASSSSHPHAPGEDDARGDQTRGRETPTSRTRGRNTSSPKTPRATTRVSTAKRDHDARYDELAERHARARAGLASLHSTLGRAAVGRGRDQPRPEPDGARGDAPRRARAARTHASFGGGARVRDAREGEGRADQKSQGAVGVFPLREGSRDWRTSPTRRRARARDDRGDGALERAGGIPSPVGARDEPDHSKGGGRVVSRRREGERANGRIPAADRKAWTYRSCRSRRRRARVPRRDWRRCRWCREKRGCRERRCR